MDLNNKDTLPIYISPEDLRKNPKFAQLINQLRKRLSPLGTSLYLQKDLDLARHNLSQARISWLMNHIVHSEVSELLAELEIKALDDDLSLSEKQFKDVLARILAFNELGNYLHFQPDPSSRSTLFGLSSQDCDRHNPVSQHVTPVQQTALPLIEDRLREKCEKLYNFYNGDPDSCSTSDQLLIAKSRTLPSVVEQKLKEIEEHKEALAQNCSQREKQFWLYYEKLLESLALIQEMLGEHKLKTQTQVDMVNIEWLKAQCETLSLKLLSTKLQISTDIYDTETVKALQKVSDHLDKALKQTEKDLAVTKHSLQGYRVIGGEFKTLVEEFTQLEKEVGSRRWGLQQLKLWENGEKKDCEGASSLKGTEDVAQALSAMGIKENDNVTNNV